MTKQKLTCSMCGYCFDPEGLERCKSCPLHVDCSLVCCPSCGYEVINLEGSRLARWFSRWLPSTARPVASGVSDSSIPSQRGGM